MSNKALFLDLFMVLPKTHLKGNQALANHQCMLQHLGANKAASSYKFHIPKAYCDDDQCPGP